MGRALRAARGGIVSHILNRSNGRRPLFEHPGDYQAFERVLAAKSPIHEGVVPGEGVAIAPD